MQRFAFFDLDGTLLPWDTQLLFCNHVLRQERWRCLLLAPFFALLPFMVVRLLRSHGMKRVYLGYLWGMSRERLTRYAESFADEVCERHVWAEMKEIIARHREEGRVLVLNTASPRFYADPIARKLGFEHCVATEVVVPERMPPLIAAITGKNNKREAKIDAMRVRGLLPTDREAPYADSAAYSDSHVDLPLLALATDPVVVRPTSKLEAVARSRGWTELTPQPAAKGHVIPIMKMLVGLWKG